MAEWMTGCLQRQFAATDRQIDQLVYEFASSIVKCNTLDGGWKGAILGGSI